MVWVAAVSPCLHLSLLSFAGFLWSTCAMLLATVGISIPASRHRFAPSLLYPLQFVQRHSHVSVYLSELPHCSQGLWVRLQSFVEFQNLARISTMNHRKRHDVGNMCVDNFAFLSVLGFQYILCSFVAFNGGR